MTHRPTINVTQVTADKDTDRIGYIVTSTKNTTVPKIGERLTENAVKDLIRRSNVNISPS